MKKVYLDYAATTPVDPKVLRAMEPYFTKKYGNPSSLHKWGSQAKAAIEQARGKVASVLGAKPEEIIFTSCATESNNLAIKGVALATNLKTKEEKNKRTEKLHLITSAIEHHSVLHVCEYLEKFGLPGRQTGLEVTYLPVSKEGIVDSNEVKKAIRDNTILISIMYANNEIGTIQPITEIGQVVQKYNQQRAESRKQEADSKHLALSPQRIYFHTDAVQALQYLDCDVKKLGVDLLSLTGHKFYAPKGVGVLYLRKGTPLLPQLQGGGHERGFRSGTENVSGISGLGEAIELVGRDRRQETRRLVKLRDRLISGILKNTSGVILSGHPRERLPNNVNVCIKNVEGESMLLALDKAGIAASSGSACTSASLEPSHVLLACGIPAEVAHGSLRLTLGKWTKKEDIDYTLSVLPKIVKKLRKISPF